MHVRPIERRDFAQITEIVTQVFAEDPRMAWLNPRAAEYPEQFRHNVIERFKRRIVQRDVWGFVSVSDPEDNSSNSPESSEVVTGYALWERCNSGAPAKQNDPHRNGGLSSALERMLLDVEDHYATFYQTNPAKDYQRQALFRSGSIMKGPSVTFPAHWFLLGLAVHPDWQRKGIGQKLLDWGFNEARKEDMPVILSATPEGLPLYKKNGFKIVDAYGLPENMPAEPILIWDPQGRWIRKLEESDPDEVFGITMEVAWSADLPKAESNQ